MKLFALLILAVGSAIASSQAAVVVLGDFSNGGAPVSPAGPITVQRSPALPYSSNLSQTVSLANPGDFITLTGQLTSTQGSSSNGFRFGFLDSSSTSGIYAARGTRTGSGTRDSSIFRQTGGDFPISGGTVATVATGGFTGNISSGVSFTFTLAAC